MVLLRKASTFSAVCLWPGRNHQVAIRRVSATRSTTMVICSMRKVSVIGLNLSVRDSGKKSNLCRQQCVKLIGSVCRVAPALE